jgi:hypothetical protein
VAKTSAISKLENVEQVGTIKLRGCSRGASHCNIGEAIH